MNKTMLQITLLLQLYQYVLHVVESFEKLAIHNKSCTASNPVRKIDVCNVLFYLYTCIYFILLIILNNNNLYIFYF